MNYKRLYKIRTVDFYLMIIFLLFSAVSHFIASKIILFPSTNIPLISSTFTYMLSMPLTDLVRAYSTKFNAVKFVITEMVFIFLLITLPLLFLNQPSPNWANIQGLNIIFSLSLEVFKSNFISIFVSMFLDILLFSLLFNQVFNKLHLYVRFIFASALSTITIIIVYTYIVNIYIYKLFPHEWLKINAYSIITNIIMIVFYTFICSIIFKFINLYLEREV